MGNWAMYIDGHGIHDNGLAADADALLKKFVAELHAAGHKINHVALHVGGGTEMKVAQGPDGTEPVVEAAQKG